MGYSGRYHAASLAAVFLALAIGILIGVGLGHNVIPAAQRDLEQSLKSDLSDARGRADTLQGELNQERDFAQQVLPSLVGGQLAGKRIAVVALGTLAAAKGTPARHLVGNQDALPGVARRVGRALVVGGPPLARFRGATLARISGRPGGIDGVIVVRSQPADMNPNQSQATEALESGILTGLGRAETAPVVGVERSDSDGSSIGYFESEGATATVDSVDLTSGQVALAYALAGTRGNYGVKSSADRLLPTLRRPAPPSAAPRAP
jgi:hypothetical protein